MQAFQHDSPSFATLVAAAGLAGGVSTADGGACGAGDDACASPEGDGTGDADACGVGDVYGDGDADGSKGSLLNGDGEGCRVQSLAAEQN
jgi:hypothetical protein